MDEVDEEPVRPGFVGRPGFDPGEVGATQTEFGEDQGESTGRVRRCDEHRGLVVLRIDSRLAGGENHEARGVVSPVHDISLENLETVDLGRPGWGQRRDRRIAEFGNFPDGTRRVVSDDGLDAQVKQMPLCLRERFRVGANTAHVLQRRTGNTEDGVTDFDEMLGNDGERLLPSTTRQAVEYREHRSRRRVLDGDDESVDRAGLQRSERRREPPQPNGFALREQFADGSVAVGAGFSLISDTHGQDDRPPRYRATTPGDTVGRSTRIMSPFPLTRRIRHLTTQPLHDPESCKHCIQNRTASTTLHERPSWVVDAVFYQIFPDRFASSDRVRKPVNLEPWDSPPTYHGYKGGDLFGIVEHLDWLSGLGVNAIYLNPIFQSASNHRYHTHDYFRVDPILGGDEAFDALLASCHRRGIRVMLDGVFNHSSRGFFRFHDVLENEEQSPYVGWFHIDGFPLNPYDLDEPANYEAWWGMRALPKFNTDNAEAREFLMHVGEYWAGQGIDGWRLDVPEEIQTPGFWEEFRERTRAINPDLYVVGEIWGDAEAYVNDGTRFDGTMNYPFTTATIAFTVGDRLDPATMMDNPSYDIAPAIDAAGYRDRIGWLLDHYPDAVNLANLNLLDSHDTARISTIASGDEDSVVLALALMLTFPGPPSVYYGTEIGLEGGLDPDCRRSFPWGHEDHWNRRILAATKDLIALRHRHPALRSSGYRILWPPDDGDGSMSFAVERTGGNERLLVVVNAGRERETIPLSHNRIRFETTSLLWGGGELTVGENQATVSMAPRSAGIWRLDAG